MSEHACWPKKCSSCCKAASRSCQDFEYIAAATYGPRSSLTSSASLVSAAERDSGGGRPVGQSGGAGPSPVHPTVSHFLRRQWRVCSTQRVRCMLRDHSMDPSEKQRGLRLCRCGWRLDGAKHVNCSNFDNMCLYGAVLCCAQKQCAP